MDFHLPKNCATGRRFAERQRQKKSPNEGELLEIKDRVFLYVARLPITQLPVPIG
jgi:hypothetical protein